MNTYTISSAAIDALTETQSILPDGWALDDLDITDIGYYRIRLDLPDESETPEIEPTTRYLTDNYSVSPTMYPGLFQFRNEVGLLNFFEAIRQWLTTYGYGDVAGYQATIDHQNIPVYQKISVVAPSWKRVIAAMEQVERSAISSTTDMFEAQEFPAVLEGVPYWCELHGFRNAEIITTAAWSNTYLPLSDIPHPHDVDEQMYDDCQSALFLEGHGEDTEGEVELDYEELELPDPLEQIMLKQLLVVRETGYGDYAYVRQQFVYGFWLKAVPENRKYLRKAMKMRDFQWKYDRWDESPRTAIKAWLKRVRQLEREEEEGYV